MRRILARRAVAVAAVPTLLAAMLAGCGSDTDEPGSASDSSQVVPTSYGTYAAGDEVDKAAFIRDLVQGLDKATTSTFTVSLDHGSGDSITADGQIDLTADPVDAAVSVTLPQASDPFDVRLVDGVAYANLGPLTQGKFAKFDLGNAKNLPPQAKEMLDEIDVAKLFQKVGPSLTSVTYVGDEQVDGTTTRHFTLVVDTAKIAEMAGSHGMAGDHGTADIPKQVSIDAWFDTQFLVRKIEASTGGDEPMTVQATFSDWGRPVDIVAPPADQVAKSSGSLFGAGMMASG